MRFGKKLALSRSNNKDKPHYISHKLLKTTIERMVHQLKKSKDIGATDRILFDHIEQDVCKIHDYVSQKLGSLSEKFAELEQLGADAGFLFTEEKMLKMGKILGLIGNSSENNIADSDSGNDSNIEPKTSPFSEEQENQICLQIAELMAVSTEKNPIVEKCALEFTEFVNDINTLTSYVEINVAGFRKLLKQRLKQFGSLEYSADVHRSSILYHNLVKKSHSELISATGVYREALVDMIARKANLRQNKIANGDNNGSSVNSTNLSNLPNPFKNIIIPEVDDIGAECQMVFGVKQQLIALG